METNELVDETTRKYFSASTKKITHNFIQDQVETLRVLNPTFILDIGCGNGYTTNIYRKELGISIVGCDIDETRIRTGKKIFGGDFILANIEYLPIRTNSIDTVVASEVIEHLPEVHAPMKEIKRITWKNLIVTVPNEPYFMAANFFRGRHIKTFGNPYDHVNHFNKKTLHHYLNSFFSNISIKKSQYLWLIAIIRM